MSIETPQQITPDLDQLSREEIIGAMQTLKASLGWQVLVGVIRKGELAAKKDLLVKTEFKSLAEVENLQYKISYIEQMLELPDNLYKDFIEDNNEESDQDEDDPYYNKVKDVQADIKNPTGQMEAE